MSFKRSFATLALVTLLTACGGGGGGSESPSAGPPTGAPPVTAPPVTAPPVTAPPVTAPPVTAPPVVVVEKPATRAEAARFLTQATFGPTEAGIDALMQSGYAAWIDQQLALPARSHRAAWDAADAAIRARQATSAAGQTEVFDTFWTQAITGPDQLRQRVVFALSQIFVISMVDGTVGEQPRAAAAWLDMLGDKGLGNYRDLLEAVARHPLMGAYLSHLRNQKADARTGRVPDENFAREVMQLFTIGVVRLDEAGRASAEATYTPADISGLARVFTGFSWACPDWPDNNCFSRGTANNNTDVDRWIKPMSGYPQFHSVEEKRFLTTAIAPQSPSNPDASLKAALDALAAHPNVGPFIGRQLIQRLVTSNPSDAYVTAVSRAFADNGAGVRGDMKAVVKAVLMHPEARTVSDRSGKVREPVLRLAALLRAFDYKSESGSWRVGNTDNPASSLGQTVLRAPSVFNFWRPGYVAPGSKAAAAGLVAPELQGMHETTTAGYVNYMREVVSGGIGPNGASGRRDIQPDFTPELALADRPAELVDRVLGRLLIGAPPAALKNEIVGAVTSIAVPALNATASNQRAVDDARRARVNTALLLTLVSPEFQVQR